MSSAGIEFTDFFSLWTLLYCQSRENKLTQVSVTKTPINKDAQKMKLTSDRGRHWKTSSSILNSVLTLAIASVRLVGGFFWFSSAKQPIHFGAKDMLSFLVDEKT